MNAEALTNERPKSPSPFLNPFHFLAGGRGLIIGLAAILISCLVGAASRSHFDGVLDFHLGPPLPLWFYPLEGLIDWLDLTSQHYLFIQELGAPKARFPCVLLLRRKSQ